MSLTVSPDLLAAAERGEVSDEQFVDCVRTSLPYAWQVVSGVAAQLHTGTDEFADSQTPPPSEAERGRYRDIAALEPANRAALERVRTAADAVPRDWARYTRQAVEFHLRNAAAWGNARTGGDLAEQVDPDFVLGPTALPGAATQATPVHV